MFHKDDVVRCVSNVSISGRVQMITVGSYYTCLDDQVESAEKPGVYLVEILNDDCVPGLYFVSKFELVSSNHVDKPIDILETYKSPDIDYFSINRECSSL